MKAKILCLSRNGPPSKKPQPNAMRLGNPKKHPRLKRPPHGMAPRPPRLPGRRSPDRRGKRCIDDGPEARSECVFVPMAGFDRRPDTIWRPSPALLVPPLGANGMARAETRKREASASCSVRFRQELRRVLLHRGASGAIQERAAAQAPLTARRVGQRDGGSDE